MGCIIQKFMSLGASAARALLNSNSNRGFGIRVLE